MQRRVLAWTASALAAGALVGASQVDAAPRCFGAAARDPGHRCVNKRLRRVVTPTPDEAVLIPNLGCASSPMTESVKQCALGTSESEAVETVVVVGDSHASHWRSAFAAIAAAKRWRVLDLSYPHCLFSTAVPAIDEPYGSLCPRRTQEILAWLGAHPEIRTMFVSGSAFAPVVLDAGHTLYETRVDGYIQAWQQLPPSIQHLLVLRDVPRDTLRARDCVRRALALHRRADVCAVRRHRALHKDSQIAAAKRLGSGRVRVIDLTPYLCDSRRCYSVVGGVLVHRDIDHMTPLFATTLAPFLLRRIEAILECDPIHPGSPGRLTC